MSASMFGFSNDYLSDGGKSYLVLDKEGLSKTKLVWFQVEMLTNNEIKGIVKLDVREKDSKVKLYYNLSGLVILSNFLKRNKISKSDFISILDMLISVILNNNNYFLNDQSLVLDEKMVFIDPKSREVYLIYIPVEIHQDIIQSLKAFIIKLIVSANIETRDDFIQQMLNLIKVEDFNLSDFRNQLKAVRDEVNTSAQSVRDEVNTSAQSVSKKGSSEGNVDPSRTITVTEGRNIRTLFLGGVAIISILAAAISYWGVNLKFLMNQSGVTTRMLTYGAAAAACIGVTFRILHKESNDVPAAEKTASNKTEPEPTKSPEFTASNELTRTPGGGTDDTVLLSELNFPELMTVNGQDSVLIDKPIFIIGRNREVCDYVIEDRGVGRAHAQIRKVDSFYFIEDMDSKNGTFLNDEKISSNQQYKLNRNDKVTIANVEYLFTSK
ncbi:MAG: DUF6382 domain-containing protein [Eubacteriales bacterium]